MDIVTILGKDYDSNIYIVLGKVPTLIDTGTGFHSQEVLHEIQKALPITQLQQVILTHEHYDHVGGVLSIASASKGSAKILAHQAIVPKLKEGKSTFAELLGGTMPKITVDIALSGNEDLTLGNQHYDVLLTPGHSIGSLCLYAEKNQVLFSGDTIFANGGFGRYDFPGGDFTTLLHSIERLAALDIQHLYPGHGPTVEQNVNDHVKRSLENIQSLM